MCRNDFITSLLSFTIHHPSVCIYTYKKRTPFAAFSPSKASRTFNKIKKKTKRSKCRWKVCVLLKRNRPYLLFSFLFLPLFFYFLGHTDTATALFLFFFSFRPRVCLCTRYTLPSYKIT